MTRPGRPLVAANRFNVPGPQFSDGPLGTDAPTSRLNHVARRTTTLPGGYGAFRVFAAMVESVGEMLVPPRRPSR